MARTVEPVAPLPEEPSFDPEEHASPPQASDAEEALLCACLLSRNAVEAAAEVVRPRDFYFTNHGRIFETILGLYADDQPVDAITVRAELERRGDLDRVGGEARLQEIAGRETAAGHARRYARIVRDQAVLRGVARAGHEMIQAAHEPDGRTAAEVAETAERIVFDLSQERATAEFVRMSEAVPAAYERLTVLRDQGREVVGIPTGLTALDQITSGLHRGNLVVVAGRPSIGKTSAALSIVSNVVLAGTPVALFTLEMSEAEVTDRLFAIQASASLARLRNGMLRDDEWRRVTHAAGRLSNAPLYIDDGVLLTVMEMRSRARRLKMREPDLAVVMVDYLQLMQAENDRDGRVQQVSVISRGLKVLARELDVAVIAVSQLSRAPEQRHDKRPILADLRESGSIEQDADVVAFVYRDEYYHPEDAKEDGTEGIAELHLAKHRNGPTDTVKLSFQKVYARFGDLVPGDDPTGAGA